MYLTRKPYPSEIGRIQDFLNTKIKSYLEFQNPADRTTDKTAVWEAHRKAADGEFVMTDKWLDDERKSQIVLCEKVKGKLVERRVLVDDQKATFGEIANGVWLLPYHFII